MAASASSGLQQLHEEVGDGIQFVTLYVREAHPGERIPQAETPEEKMAHAQAYARRDRIPWPVAVDDLDGTVHRLLGRLPDSVCIVDSQGRAAAQVLWSNDTRGLRSALRAVLNDERPPAPRRRASTVPLLRGVGVVDEVLRAAGRSAMRDMMVTAPPVYTLGRVASLFKPLPPLARGTAAVVAFSAAIFFLGKALRRRRGNRS